MKENARPVQGPAVVVYTVGFEGTPLCAHCGQVTPLTTGHVEQVAMRTPCPQSPIWTEGDGPALAFCCDTPHLCRPLADYYRAPTHPHRL